MKTVKIFLALLAMAMASPGWATNYYVVASGSTPTPPWTNWGWAHTNLIEVVARARDNDTVYVTNNATYYLTNQASISYAITVRSWASDGSLDPATTILNGNYNNTTNRIFYVDNYGAWVKGFTITNGCVVSPGVYIGGGGVYLSKGHLTNCVVTGNRYYGIADGGGDGGGGIYCNNYSGSVWNCTISYNTSYASGGGIKVFQGTTWLITNCTIAGNVCSNSGGGISVYNPSDLKVCNSRIVSNSAYYAGGGINIAYHALVNRCVISYNYLQYDSIRAPLGGGGASMGGGTLQNCVIANNYGAAGQGRGGGVFIVGNATHPSLVQNCTIYNNTNNSGGGVYWWSIITNGFVENSIIWANSDNGTSSNYAKYDAGASYSFTNCCVAPDPGESYRTNCVFSDPKFAGLAIGNVRLQPGSPCINAGINQTWMDGAKDIEGLSRIDRFSGRVDMGAYEYLSHGAMFSGH